jgi:hypothetical protein
MAYGAQIMQHKQIALGKMSNLTDEHVYTNTSTTV